MTETNRVPVPPSILTIFGAGGDLTWRKLIPALFDLHVGGFLPANFAIVGLDIKDYNDESFREHALDGIKTFARFKDHLDDKWSGFETKLSYLAADFDAQKTYKDLGKKIKAFDANNGVNADHIFYMATAPRFVEVIAAHLAEDKLLTDHARSRIVVEKPFSTDLATAIELNARLRKFCPEDQIYRIDHYLGKETVQNILAFRFANAMFEPIWNRNYIDHVQITVAESVGVGHRGGYYDRAGALRDMVQNHLMQILCLVAMEPPVSFGADEIRSRKVDVLRAVRPIDHDDIPEYSARGQYSSGWVQGEKVDAYTAESEVPADSNTETFAALKLYVDNWRWRGVPFYMRSGKRLTERVSEVVVRFKPVPHQSFPESASNHWAPNDLIIFVQPNEGIAIKMQAKKPGLMMQLGTVDMAFTYKDAFKQPSPEAYETLLLDAIRGDATLFMRSDQVEKAWEIVMPVLNYWEQDQDIETYDAGSWGPDSATELIARDGRSWVRPQKIEPQTEDQSLEPT